MVNSFYFRIISRCPIEDGVIKTDWGTVSPGTLVAALASALEPQRVTISDILNAEIFKEEVSQALVDSAMEDWYTQLEEYTPEEQVDDADPSSDASNNISNLWVATLAGMGHFKYVENTQPMCGFGKVTNFKR